MSLNKEKYFKDTCVGSITIPEKCNYTLVIVEARFKPGTVLLRFVENKVFL
jgi:hypothetical protein